MPPRYDQPNQYAGCYSLDLYCDRKRSELWDHQYVRSFHGETFSQCARAARKAGWVIHKDRTATCPVCLKEMKA